MRSLQDEINQLRTSEKEKRELAEKLEKQNV